MNLFSLKNIINKDSQLKQGGFIGLGWLIVIGISAAITYFAAPAVADWFVEGAIKTAVFVVGLGITIPALIASYVFALALDVSHWIMSISMEMPITSGWAYEYGWRFTRDLVNMFFIIILAFIGLATILRIEGYQAKKTLPKLIIIALLINFSPVIVGFIIDIFNIITNYFLAGVQIAKELMDPQKIILDNMWSLFSDLFSTEDIGVYISHTFIIGITLIYFVFGTFIFATIALLFLVRIIAFWALFILAPIAFAAYILPATKKWWDMWWSQLIHWAAIGVTVSFFLFLSSKLLEKANELFPTDSFKESLQTTSSYIQNQAFSDLLVTILPYGVCLVFMFLGIVLGLQTGAMGASQIIGFSKRTGTRARKWAGTKGKALAKGTARGTQQRVRERIPERVKLWAARKSAAPTWGTGVTGVKGLAMRTMGTPFGRVRRGMGGLITRTTIQAEEGDALKTREEAMRAEKNALTNLALMRGTPYRRGKGEILAVMAERGQIKDALNEKVVGKKNVLSEREILEGYESIVKTGDKKKMKAYEDALLSDPDEKKNVVRIKTFAAVLDKNTRNLAPNDITIGGISKEDKQRGIKTFEDKIMIDIKNLEDMKRLQKGWWKNADLREAAMKFWQGPQLRAAAELFGKEFVDTHMGASEKKGRQWFLENNQGALTFLAGNAGQDAGYHSLGGLDQKEVRDRVQCFREWEQAKKPKPLDDFWKDWYKKKYSKKKPGQP